MVRLYHYTTAEIAQKILTEGFSDEIMYFCPHPTFYQDSDCYGQVCLMIDVNAGDCYDSDSQYNLLHADEIIETIDNNEYIDECDVEILIAGPLEPSFFTLK